MYKKNKQTYRYYFNIHILVVLVIVEIIPTLYSYIALAKPSLRLIFKKKKNNLLNSSCYVVSLDSLKDGIIFDMVFLSRIRSFIFIAKMGNVSIYYWPCDISALWASDMISSNTLR